MIIKIMHANRGNDDHPRQAYKLIEDVLDVDFYEAGDNGEQPGVYITRRGQTPDEATCHPLTGNVYVMTDHGKTFDRFEVAPPKHVPSVYINGRAVEGVNIGGPISAGFLREFLEVGDRRLVRIHADGYDVIGRGDDRHMLTDGDRFFTDAEDRGPPLA